MTRDERGWWQAEAPDVGPGADYAFSLEGGPPFPDPRSPFQPHGVHGPSRVIAHSDFAWTDAGWQAPPLAAGLVYELHIGTFTPAGTFEAAIGKLDHLLDLGVTHMELMPVAEFPGARGWGYDGVSVFAPHHAYGGPLGLKQLVDACHARGLAVLLDVVYNHLGPDGNYLGQYGPYFTDRYHTPWGEAVNFDGPDSDEVRRFFVDNALLWLRDYHFDGLRLDAVHAIVDTSATHILEELAVEVERLGVLLGRRFVLIAESDLNDPRLVRAREVGGYGLDAQWSDDFHHALHTALTGERSGYYADFGSLAALAKALRQAYVFDGAHSPFRKRRHGRAPEGVPAHRFLGYLQNHDQVGNRAQGERSSHLLTPDQLKIGAALTLTAPFVPMLFQGEEWGATTPFLYFTEHEHEALGRAVSEGRRQEFAAFGWQPEQVPDPQSPETFARSKLNWDERRREPHASLLAWHRRLIELRRELPDLCADGFSNTRVSFDEAARWLVVERGAACVACNLAEREQALLLPPGPWRARLASHPPLALTSNAVTLPPQSVAVMVSGPS